MKNKIYITLLTMFMFLTIMGCGKDKTIDEDNPFINGNDTQNNEKENETNTELKLYSDDTKLVFNFSDIYQIVYYFEGDKITGLEYYYDYGTPETANYAKASIEAAQEDNVKSVKQNGKYVVVTFDKAEYEDLTVEEVKTTYAYLEQVYATE